MTLYLMVAFLKSPIDARDKFADFVQPVKIWRKQWETRKHARQTGSNFLPQYASAVQCKLVTV